MSEGEPCGVCARPHEQPHHPGRASCSRHKSDGSPCGAAPLTGVKVCKAHGGNAPSHQKRHHATVAALAMGLDPAMVAANPLQALSAYASETATQYRTIKDELAGMLDTLDDAVYTDVNGVERIRGKVTIFERVCDRLEKSLEALAKLNIDERLTRIEAAKVQFLITALEAALEDAGFDVTDRERARIAIVRQLDSGRPQLRGVAG